MVQWSAGDRNGDEHRRAAGGNRHEPLVEPICSRAQICTALYLEAFAGRNLAPGVIFQILQVEHSMTEEEPSCLNPAKVMANYTYFSTIYCFLGATI